MLEITSDLIDPSIISSMDEIGGLFKGYGKVEIRTSDGKVVLFRNGEWLGEGKVREVTEIDCIGTKMTYDGNLFTMTKAGWFREGKFAKSLARSTRAIYASDRDILLPVYTEKLTYPLANFVNYQPEFGRLRQGSDATLFLNTNGDYEWFKVGDCFTYDAPIKKTIVAFNLPYLTYRTENGYEANYDLGYELTVTRC